MPVYMYPPCIATAWLLSHVALARAALTFAATGEPPLRRSSPLRQSPAACMFLPPRCRNKQQLQRHAESSLVLVIKWAHWDGATPLLSLVLWNLRSKHPAGRDSWHAPAKPKPLPIT